MIILIIGVQFDFPRSSDYQPRPNLHAKPRRTKARRAYLHTVAKGLLINHWRRRDVERAYLEALAATPEACAPSPEARLLIIETLVRIDHMLAALPDKVRQAFLLSQLDGLTYAVIAERLGVSERMVKKYMARAMFECLLVADDHA